MMLRTAQSDIFSMPVEVEVLLEESLGTMQDGASMKLSVQNLGLPASALLKETSRAEAPDDGAHKQALVAAAAHAAEMQAKVNAARSQIDAEVSKLVGLGNVKKWFEEMRGKVRLFFN